MKQFLYVTGSILWLIALIYFWVSPTVTQEIAMLLIALNGTLMIVGGAVIGAIHRYSDSHSHRKPSPDKLPEPVADPTPKPDDDTPMLVFVMTAIIVIVVIFLGIKLS
jgi:hypothetical protein